MVLWYADNNKYINTITLSMNKSMNFQAIGQWVSDYPRRIHINKSEDKRTRWKPSHSQGSTMELI